MNLDSLYDVYVSQLKDAYSSEKQLTEALPKLVQTSATPELKQAFEKHLAETQTHLERVQAILDELDENPGSTVCHAMRGLIDEGSDVIRTHGDAKAKDAALILAAQKAEHYEIALYGGLRAYARVLGYDDAAATLSEILDQEYEADQKLDEIAEGGLLTAGVNVQAQE